MARCAKGRSHHARRTRPTITASGARALYSPLRDAARTRAAGQLRREGLELSSRALDLVGVAANFRIFLTLKGISPGSIDPKRDLIVQ